MLGYDRKARAAANVAAFIEFMRERRFLTAEHFNCEGLQNWLPESRISVPRSEDTQKLLNLCEQGKVKLKFLVSRLLPPYFESKMSSEDMLALCLKKPLKRGRWTRSGAVKSLKQISNLGEARNNARHGGSRYGYDSKQILLTHTERVSKRLRLLQELALSTRLSEEVVREAKRSAARVQEISSLVSSESTAYGLWVENSVPRRRSSRPAVKSNFFHSLQSHCTEKLGSDGVFMSEDGIFQSGYAEAHIDIENIINTHIHCSRVLLNFQGDVDQEPPKAVHHYSFRTGPKEGCVVISMDSDCRCQPRW